MVGICRGMIFSLAGHPRGHHVIRIKTRSDRKHDTNQHLIEVGNNTSTLSILHLMNMHTLPPDNILRNALSSQSLQILLAHDAVPTLLSQIQPELLIVDRQVLARNVRDEKVRDKDSQHAGRWRR